MKNLTNCTPREFLSQTVKIRKEVAAWIKAMDFKSLKEKLPDFPKNATEDEKMKIVQEKMTSGFLKIFDAAFETNADKTLSVLALINFVDPEKVNEHTMSEYFDSMGEMIGDKGVLRFFTSLVQLGKVNI